MDLARFDARKIPDPQIQAIQITWARDPKDLQFWKTFALTIFPMIQQLHKTGAVLACMPFEHKPTAQNNSGTWSTTVFCIGAPGRDLRDVCASMTATDVLQPPDTQLVGIDLLRLQPNLDMFYPIKSGLRREENLLQWIEYVFSDPQHKIEYYNSQYIFSGPAMKRLHVKDNAGRFLGFEVLERVSKASIFPLWDVVHISGFTPLQIFKAIPRFRRTWDLQAQEVWGGDARGKDKMSEWHNMREKIMPKERQIHSFTLQSELLT